VLRIKSDSSKLSSEDNYAKGTRQTYFFFLRERTADLSKLVLTT